jgi:membrane protease YdiL (CAAX protease family)
MNRDLSLAPDPTASAPNAPAAPAGDRSFAAKLRGFGPIGIAVIVLVLLGGSIGFLPIGATIVLLWARYSHTPWSAIGYVRPRSWLLTIAGGVLFGAAFKLAMKSLVMPLLGAPPVNATFHYLAGNRAALPVAILMMLNAGFSEETIFRGFLFERLGRLFGGSMAARVAIVLITTTLFAFGHWQQSWPGIEQAAITGLTFATMVMITRRLPFAMIAHAAFDLTALALIYTNTETQVAHWFLQ